MKQFLDFEKPIADLQAQIAELRETADSGELDVQSEIDRLQTKSDKLLKETYSKLTPWQRTQVARHPDRPHFKHYVAGFVEDFLPLSGDRAFAEDEAVVGGFGTIGGIKAMVIGHEKGDTTESRLRHNFGMAKPEGYRKSIRLMRLADRFGLPIVTLVDTPGAFPGIQAEERAQAEAIARSTEACLQVGVPIVTAIVGEGGSGGAIALSTANSVLMFENAIYSVISPEGCASILWRTADKASEAAEAMRISAPQLEELGIIDRIVPEPAGGAHRHPEEAIATLAKAIAGELEKFADRPAEELVADRRTKFLKMGN